MVDGVNFNPFTGKVFTTEEINKMDTDKNGAVSYEELEANMSWLSGESDSDGDVAIDEGDTKASSSAQLTSSDKKLYTAAQANGVKDTATSSDEIKEYLNTIQDEFIQQYMKDNPGMTSEEKSSFVTFIKSAGTEFIEAFMQKNPKAATFDTQSIAAELLSNLNEAVKTREATQVAVNEKMEAYKNSSATSFKNLAEYTDSADDDYVTGTEYKEMQQQAVNYLMGAMIGGTEDAEFMKNFDIDYKNNKNYQTAMKAISDLQNCSDPQKMEELIAQAEKALTSFLGTQNVDGTSKLNNAVVSKDQKEKDAIAAEQKAAYKEQLSAINDKMVENMSTETLSRHRFFSRNSTRLAHSKDEVEAYATTLNKILDKFLSEYTGDGKNIESEYRVYAAKIQREMQTANYELESSVMNSADAFQSLKDTVSSTGTYLSKTEEAEIKSQTLDFIISEMAQGKFDISLLEQLYPEYAKDSNFVEAKALMEGFKTSITRADDLAKIKELLSTMIDNIGADKLADGIKNKTAAKLPSMTASQREDFTSSIPGYDDNESVSTGRYKKREDALDDIQNQAKQKLESLRSQLKAMYKDQMGADYDEAKVDEYIDEAIYTTINQFTDMRVDKNGKHYSTNDAGFVTSKSGKKSRGVYNVKQLVDTFLANFETISSGSQKTEGKNPVSLNSIMKDTSLADDYQDKTTNRYRSMSEAKLAMKSKINIIAVQLKAKLKAELGSEYDGTKIEQMISQATLSCLDGIKENHGFVAIFKGKATFNTNDVANKFYEEFNKLYESAAKGTTETTTETTETK